MITSLVIWLRKKTTIKFRIFLFTGFMICSLYLMTLGAMQQHLSSTKEEKIESLRFISNEVLASASASALWRGRKDELAELTTKLIESTDINYIAIYDSEGDLFFKYGERDFDDNAVEIRRDVEKLSVVPGFDDFDSDGVAVSTEKVKLGYLEAQIDESNVSDLAWSGLWRNFTFLVVVCLLVLPLAYILAMSLVRPLRGIVSDLQKFESGDYENLIGNSKYNDEYGAISDALKKAGASISTKTGQIENANKELLDRSKQLEHQRDIAMEARQLADEANAKKDVFVSNITHELKTPLTGVIASIDLIEQSISSMFDEGYLEKQSIDSRKQSLDFMQLISCIDLAKFSGSQLETLVNEILISIEDMYSDISLDLHPIDLVASLNKLMDAHKIEAIGKGLDFKVQVSSDPGIWVLADWLRLAQVVNGLLSNAVRFTEHGSVEVQVRVLGTKDQVSLYVEVNDTGVGISAAEKERIFSLFHIAEEPTKKMHSGIGTGLAIAQRICERTGSKLTLNSTELGKGSSFGFSCSFERCEAVNVVSIDARKTAKSVEKYRGIKLLYVEDSSTNQMIFQEYCKRYEVDLVVANNGLQGLEKCEHGTFDALVVDCYMPVMTGYEMVEKLRYSGDEDSFIIALSADNSKKNVEKCRDSGFNEFVAKPYTKETFKHLLDMVLEQKNERDVIGTN
ncbi:hypothetical protein R50073_49140 (plasmid) [Maricurvus nonylphenolicus]|jgi:signal transduction histidine kinase/ActR/RegA family two-component response regulator|uniref:ATP-binding response regulator n=1 Tax=Maricurvus nonylphenolicus TaxID=1008307 RepID=UPI0036F3EFAB